MSARQWTKEYVTYGKKYNLAMTYLGPESLFVEGKSDGGWLCAVYESVKDSKFTPPRVVELYGERNHHARTALEAMRSAKDFCDRRAAEEHKAAVAEQERKAKAELAKSQLDHEFNEAVRELFGEESNETYKEVFGELFAVEVFGE